MHHRGPSLKICFTICYSWFTQNTAPQKYPCRLGFVLRYQFCFLTTIVSSPFNFKRDTTIRILYGAVQTALCCYTYYVRYNNLTVDGTTLCWVQLFILKTSSESTTLSWVQLFCSCLTVKDEVGEEGWILGLDKLVAGQK